MITLFSEEVETTSTNSDHNTLYVESFEEAFFGVYEFEINNTTVIAEQVGKVGNAPVVRIPVVESNGTKTEVDFILRKGPQRVELGNVDTLATDEVETIIENASDTIKGRNTLYVDSFKETFFGVYEFIFNGKKVVAEKTDEIYSHPIVKLPVVESNGSTGEVEFILKVGNKDSNIGDSKAVLLEDSMSLIKEEDLKARIRQETKTLVEDDGSKNINISYRIDRDEIIEEIKTDSQAALDKLREETKNIVNDVERIRDSIFIEFASNSDTYRANESKKLKQFVDKKVEELRETNEVLAGKVERETRDSLESTYGSFIKKLNETQQELEERKKAHLEIVSTVNALEKTQIELRDDVNTNKREILEATEKSEKSVNKALSRLGTVKKELTDSKAEFDSIKDALAHSIILAEERVKKYYHEKIEEVENTIFDNVRRDEILKVVKESKAKILTELSDTSDIKEQLRVIATEKYDPITGKEFQRKLKKNIDDKFAAEMSNIRRMIELYSGGGTNAVQFADGGTMNGDLNVTTNILSAGTNLLDIFTSGGSDLNGSGTTGTITIWDGEKTLGDSILSANASCVYLNGDLGIGTATPSEALEVVGNIQVEDGEFIGDLRGAVHFKAEAGENISAGQAVYISGISGNTTVVSLADANDASKMPAFGIATETASSGNPITIGNFGALNHLNTVQWGAEGDELYIGTTAGQLISAAPTGENAKLQKIAKITRAHASAGSITIMGAGRTNAVPNLNEGRLFVGNSSNQAVADGTVHVDIANSRVGIGTTTPGRPLDVQGSVTSVMANFKYTGASYSSINLANTVGCVRVSSVNNDLLLSPGAVEKLRITANGNVGIGTSAPATKLHVDGDSLVTGNSTIYGNLSVTGDFTCIETTVSTTSAFSVTNTGTGPALYICQTGIQPIAHFIDANGDDIVFADDGKVGIGVAVPDEKLTISGNLSASGNLTIDGTTTLGNAASDTVTINACGITFGNGLAGGSDAESTVVILNDSGLTQTNEIDAKVWGTALVDGEGTQNAVPKYTNGTGTIGDSNITDTGSLVTIDSNTKIDADHDLSIYAAGGSIYSSEKTFTATVGTGGTIVPTFAKSGLESAKFTVVLVNGVNKTAFEILVVYNGTSSVGTVYGIVDAQAASQLDAIDVSNTGSTIDLVITSASAGTTAIIQGKALY